MRMYADTQEADPGAAGGHVDVRFVDLAVEVFSMLADPTRVRIVLCLRAGELPVNAIAAAVGKAPAAVSQHLAKLRLARIVAARQDGNRVFYRLENEHASRLVTDAIHQAEHAIGQPRHHRNDPTTPA
jgi:DNA-binding transcriptional ArsR family regulator